MKVRILSYTTRDGVKHPLDPPVVIEERCAHVRRAENHQIEYVESCGIQYIDTGINPANAVQRAQKHHTGG